MGCLLLLPNAAELFFSLVEEFLDGGFVVRGDLFLLPAEDFHVVDLVPTASDEFLALYALLEEVVVVLPQHVLFQKDDEGEKRGVHDVPRNQSSNQQTVLYLE